MVRQEYSGPALKVVPVWSFRLFGPKRPFPFDKKLLSSVPLFCFLLTRTITKSGGLGQVFATGMYHSIGHVKFPKFQTVIFVEWKAPLVTSCIHICCYFASNKSTCFYSLLFDKRQGGVLLYRVFSQDVTAAILVSKNNATAAMLVSQTSPVGVELFSYATISFVPINLHRC